MINIEIAWIEESGKSIEIKTKNTILINILKQWNPEIDWENEFANKNICIWNKPVTQNYCCQDNDRIEWLQDRICKPINARRKRLS